MKNSSPVFLPMDSLPWHEGLTEGMGDTARTGEVREAPRLKSEARQVAVQALQVENRHIYIINR